MTIFTSKLSSLNHSRLTEFIVHWNRAFLFAIHIAQTRKISFADILPEKVRIFTQFAVNRFRNSFETNDI